MSDGVLGKDATTAELVAFLASVPLLEGLPEVELENLAGLLRPREASVGEVLWRQGEDARGMVLVAGGEVSVSLHLPAGRTLELARMGSGEVLGEIPLLDGGSHSATARVTEPATLLALSRADFAVLVSRRHPTAFTLKRRFALVACTRLRARLATLTTTLGDDGGAPDAAALPPPAELEPARPPNSAYVRRLATFRAFDSLALWGLLTAGRYARCAPGRTLFAEGAPSDACYLTMNGAVERIIVRGGRRIRVGLAGPGQAFGYETLIDGLPAPVTAATRERTLLLIVPRGAFERLFRGETADSHVFLDVIHRDLMAALRQAHRPNALLAASV
jgi:CRP-like cAMP-binding protein